MALQSYVSDVDNEKSARVNLSDGTRLGPAVGGTAGLRIGCLDVECRQAAGIAKVAVDRLLVAVLFVTIIFFVFFQFEINRTSPCYSNLLSTRVLQTKVVIQTNVS